ncbi:MAG: GTPase HflX [Candidatus Bipolaricaulis sp.]|nr:GTPase HflX [Candidatus Bipolaricaulis sp.]
MNGRTPDVERLPLVEDRLGERARVYGNERAVLVGIDRGHAGEDLLDELQSLADTAGIVTLATVTQKRERPDPATFIGKGKLEEVRAACDELGADAVIFNDELHAGQTRNLEDALGRKVIDRTQLIMDIFAQRATSKEAKLQVELAQLRYRLPRLRGWGAALTRTGGGIGTRGPGETKLEIDRDKITRRIHALEKRLRTAADERAVRRKLRGKSDLPQVALVGYTNSGKSTLLNRLTNADGFVEDKLFATLDTMVRRGPLPEGREALFIDTVGFIRDLPHHLVPAFAATLEAVRYADLVVHIVDIARLSWNEDYRSVLDTLEREVFRDGDVRPPVLNALNKIDLCLDGAERDLSGVRISARDGTHIDALLAAIGEALHPADREIELVVPYAVLGRFGGLRDPRRVRSLEYTAEGVRVRVLLSPAELAEVEVAGGKVSASASSPAEGPRSRRPSPQSAPGPR